LDYLEGYCDAFELSSMIRRNTRVMSLQIVEGTSSAFCSDWPQIRLEYAAAEMATTVPTPLSAPSADRADAGSKTTTVALPSTSANRTTTEVFDAVCVCNGHYSLPFVPRLRGLDNATSFGIQVLHSIAYDSPEKFGGKRVLCVGGRASGSDLARELTAHASAVYLSDSSYQGDDPWTQHGVTLLPRTTRIIANNTVEFSAQGDFDLTPLSVQVDVIIFCTGYDYNFPFISAQTSNLQLQVGDRRVSPLVEQLWHPQIPNLAFLGLPHSIVPFPLMELQAQACLNQWSQEGKDLPPTEDERMRFALADASAGGPNRSGRIQDTHYLGNAQWSYCRKLAERYAQHVWSDEYRAYLETNEVCSCYACSVTPSMRPLDFAKSFVV
jgi:hypothetical protein